MKKRIVKVSAIRRIAVMAFSVFIMAALLAGCGKQAGTTEQNPAIDTATDTAADAAVDGSGDSGTGNKTVITPPVKDENVIEHWINNEGYVVTVDVNHDDYKTAQDPVDAPEKFNGNMRASNIVSAFDPKASSMSLRVHPLLSATADSKFQLADLLSS